MDEFGGQPFPLGNSGGDRRDGLLGLPGGVLQFILTRRRTGKEFQSLVVAGLLLTEAVHLLVQGGDHGQQPLVLRREVDRGCGGGAVAGEREPAGVMPRGAGRFRLAATKQVVTRSREHLVQRQLGGLIRHAAVDHIGQVLGAIVSSQFRSAVNSAGSDGKRGA
jgi:hypothetical protein